MDLKTECLISRLKLETTRFQLSYSNLGLTHDCMLRYTDLKFSESTVPQTDFIGLNKFNHKAQYEFLYLLAARKNTDQPIATKADKFTEFNYGAIVYSKTALAMDYLMNYLGKEKFDDAMRFYFEQWKYKHPNPTDLIKTLQYYLNADLKWFESELFLTNHKIDYKIVSHKLLSDKSHVILVKNKNMLLGPVSISGYKDGKLVGSVWYNGFKGKRVFEFPPSNVDEFIIDSIKIKFSHYN